MTTPVKKNAISWFELFVIDFDRAKKFYETVLKTTLQPGQMEGCQMGMFPCDCTGGGVGGAISKMDGFTPGPGGSLVYLNAEGDLDGILERVPSAGGTVVKPRMAIGEHGFIAIIKDTEGNVVGLHSMV